MSQKKGGKGGSKEDSLSELLNIQQSLEGDNQTDILKALESFQSIPESSQIREYITQCNVIPLILGQVMNEDQKVLQLAFKSCARIATWQMDIRKQLCDQQLYQGMWNIVIQFKKNLDQGLYQESASQVEAAPAKGGKKKSSNKEEQPQIWPDEGVLDSVLSCLRGLCFAFSFVMDWVYERSLLPLVACLAHPSQAIKLSVVCTLRVLTQMGNMRLAMCAAGVLDYAKDIIVNDKGELRLQLLYLMEELTSSPGPRQAQLTEMDVPPLLLQIITDPDPEKSAEYENESGIPRELDSLEKETQAVAASLCRNIIKCHKAAKQQVLDSYVLNIISCLLPSPKLVPGLLPSNITNRPSSQESAQQEVANILLQQNHKNRSSTQETTGSSISKKESEGGPKLPSQPTDSRELMLGLLQILWQILDDKEFDDLVAVTMPDLHNRVLYFLLPVQKQMESQAEQETAPTKNDKKAKGKGLTSKKTTELDESAAAVAKPEQLPEFGQDMRCVALQCLTQIAKRGDFVVSEMLSSQLFMQMLETSTPIKEDIERAFLMDFITELVLNYSKKFQSLSGEQVDTTKDKETLNNIYKLLVARVQEASQKTMEKQTIELLKTSTARAVLSLEQKEFKPKIHPPLPSPPPTPPPPPLPTSLFIWDALGQPVQQDGLMLKAE